MVRCRRCIFTAFITSTTPYTIIAHPITKSGAEAMDEGEMTAMRPTRSVSVGIIQKYMPTRARREAAMRFINCVTAPRMSMAARIYMRLLTNVPGIMARIRPRIRLPRPTMGNAGRMPRSWRPCASNTCTSSLRLRAMRYEAHEKTPDMKNNTPMAIVIHVTVCSRYLTSSAPTTMAQIARRSELCNTFIG